MRIARRVIGLVFIAALAAPASARAPLGLTPIPADYVVVSTTQAVATANTSPFTLRFVHDGTAVYDGLLDGRDGHYVASVDFASVQMAIADADLCRHTGIPLVIQAPMSTLSAPDAQSGPAKRHVLVRLRCENTTRTFNERVERGLPGFADRLLGLATGLSWRYTGPAQRESITRFAQ
jgi:hypothetical protein